MPSSASPSAPPPAERDFFIDRQYQFVPGTLKLFNLCQGTLKSICTRERSNQSPPTPETGGETDFFIDNLLVRIHFVIVTIRWTGLAPVADLQFRFPGGLTPTFLVTYFYLHSTAIQSSQLAKRCDSRVRCSYRGTSLIRNGMEPYRRDRRGGWRP